MGSRRVVCPALAECLPASGARLPICQPQTGAGHLRGCPWQWHTEQESREGVAGNVSTPGSIPSRLLRTSRQVSHAAWV